MISKPEGKRISQIARPVLHAGHHIPLAYARPRMGNATVHDRAPRANACIRMGVVSYPEHLESAQLPSVRSQISSLLKEHGERGGVVVTSLVSPTDRLFASVAREMEMSLSLVIPCKNVQAIFTTPDDLSEFMHLRMMADFKTVLDHKAFTREAFEKASQLIVELCDVLVTVGDDRSSPPHLAGQSIVDYAGERGKRVVLIRPHGSLRVRRTPHTR